VLGSNDKPHPLLGECRRHRIERALEEPVVPLAKPNPQALSRNACNGQQDPVATAKCEKRSVEILPWYQLLIYAIEGCFEGVSLRGQFVVNLAAFPGACAFRSRHAAAIVTRIIPPQCPEQSGAETSLVKMKEHDA